MEWLLLLDTSIGEMLLKVVLNALTLMAGTYFLKGVEIEDFTRAVIVAVLLAFLNATLGSFLDFISIPLRFLTLGLFSFVVDAAMLLLAAHFLRGFKIDNFLSAFLLAILLGVFNSIVYAIFL
ncbi:MAG: phage holin family protein [Chitinophagales bacterium]|nr:phage holin family protein [Chitinophagales bacterium]